MPMSEYCRKSRSPRPLASASTRVDQLHARKGIQVAGVGDRREDLLRLVVDVHARHDGDEVGEAGRLTFAAATGSFAVSTIVGELL